ncbi:MAG TPA: tail fiber domain-containing protein, partial [Candidatus Kapabacteria bacterium]|nr:tail fiber domain-containing protein [Candidatus Kapabacteria bacterium]
SNKLYIANTDTSFPLLYGDFYSGILAVNGYLGVGRQAPSYPLHMASGAYCSVGGTWTNASSRALKENIENLSIGEAVETLTRLNPVKYNYKIDKADKHVGFIAEDVPDLVATTDRKGLSPMDITAVLTKVVQELKLENQKQQDLIQEQQKIISDLQERMAKLEKN